MLLSPILRLCPRLSSWMYQTRNVRPIIKIGKEKFELCLDVHQFTIEELLVKVRPEYVIVEGKQERKIKTGCVIRHFVRKFKLPDGCDPNTVKSELSNGCLTITARREVCNFNLPCETLIPIRTPNQTTEKTPSHTCDKK